MNAQSKMGRPREFDQDAALDAAMKVFWQKSYEGATMSDLTRAMGINRSSIYAAFGDKEALFRRVMARYWEGPMTYIREALEKPTLRQVATSLLHGTVEFLSQPGQPRGCLTIQGALACGDDAEPIKQMAILWRKSGEQALRQRILKARGDGELTNKTNPAELARFLSTLMAGLGIQAANGATRDQMKRVADMALRTLPLKKSPSVRRP
jgi:AcrR family transcriptional regulator